MSVLTLFHGSSVIVEKPSLEKCKPYNDFGTGFYCTVHLPLAKEWACTEGVDGFVSRYEIETDGFQVLDLTSEEYHILHWLTMLVTYRKIRLSTPIMQQGARWLKEKFSLDISSYDLIIGYRADDSYFSFARAFLSNQITLRQLQAAMHLGELGEQVVLKSAHSFMRLRFCTYETVDSSIFYPLRRKRDLQARAAYLAELERGDWEGITLRDLIREEVQPDDPRL